MFDVQFLLAICCVMIVGFVCRGRVFSEEGRGRSSESLLAWTEGVFCSVFRLPLASGVSCALFLYDGCFRHSTLSYCFPLDGDSTFVQFFGGPTRHGQQRPRWWG